MSVYDRQFLVESRIFFQRAVNHPTARWQESEILLKLYLAPPEALQQMLVDASTKMNAIMIAANPGGDVQAMYNVKWRRVARRRLTTLVGKMVTRWKAREEQDNCTWQMMRKGGNEEEISDELERKLSANCKVTTKPIRKLAQQAKAWSERFNSLCGDETFADQPGFRERTWDRLRSIRKDMYCNIGCASGKGCN